MTQCEEILTHLKNGNSITPLQALREIGCLRLAARIADLRAAGHHIEMTMATSGKKHFASYRLARPG